MNEWMNGWTDEWLRMNGWTKGWTDERLRMNGWTRGWTDERLRMNRMNGWTTEVTRGWTDERLRSQTGWMRETCGVIAYVEQRTISSAKCMVLVDSHILTVVPVWVKLHPSFPVVGCVPNTPAVLIREWNLTTFNVWHRQRLWDTTCQRCALVEHVFGFLMR